MSELGTLLRSHHTHLCDAVLKKEAVFFQLADALLQAQMITKEARKALRDIHSHSPHKATSSMLELSIRKAQESVELSRSLCECLQQCGVQLPQEILLGELSINIHNPLHTIPWSPKELAVA